MSARRTFGLAVFTLAGATGCGAGGDFDDRFEAACAERTNMPEELCECMADRAEDQLNEDAQAMLIASLEGDEDAIAEARGNLGVAEAMQVGMFMTQAGECAISLDETGEGAP